MLRRSGRRCASRSEQAAGCPGLAGVGLDVAEEGDVASRSIAPGAAACRCCEGAKMGATSDPLVFRSPKGPAQQNKWSDPTGFDNSSLPCE